MTTDQFSKDLVMLFPEKKKMLEKHYNDYKEFLGHLFFADEINNYLFPLLQLNTENHIIKKYCGFVENMWLHGDGAVINIVDVTILERLSDDRTVWTNLGMYISDQFKNYINEELITQNVMMLHVSRI